MPHLKITDDWGVQDYEGQWIVWHVTEAEARACYANDPDAHKLCSDIDTDEVAGCESSHIVETKPENEG